MALLEKLENSFLSENILILILIILVAIIVFSFYRFFYTVKENFEVLPLSEEAVALLKDSAELGIKPPEAKVNELPRIRGLEGLCTGFDQPNQLSSISNPIMKSGEGCGWYFFAAPEKTSFSAFGNSSGPLNPETDKLAKGGKWYFGDMNPAQEKEDKKLCNNIKTCQLADLYGTRCGWCESLGRGIPVEGDFSKYKDEDEYNCLKPPIKTVAKCPVLKSNKPVPPPICEAVNGILTKECVLFLADSVGIEKASPIYSVLEGDPKGYLVPDTPDNRKFKMAFDIMANKANVPYNKEVMETREAKREAALKYFIDLKFQTTRGANDRTREVANFLVGEGDFIPDKINENSTGPFSAEQLQSEFIKLGGTEAGAFYPSKTNMDMWKGFSFKDIKAKISKTCSQDVNSVDPAVQNMALHNCFGMKVPDKSGDFLPCGTKSGVALRAGPTPAELADNSLRIREAKKAEAAAANAARRAKAAVDAAIASNLRR